MNEKELKELLNKLTLKEKIGQLVCLGGQFFDSFDKIKTGPTVNLGIKEEIIPYAGVGSNLPLNLYKKIQEEKAKEGKIPLLNCCDVIHGYQTIFPIPLALASSFDMKLIEKSASVWAMEASRNAVNISFAPMLDLARDPRWGRVMESFGEDPYLGRMYAKSYIRGMQGKLEKENIGTTVKHFAGYSLPNAGRDYDMSIISDRLFNDYYLPSYKEGLKESIMVMSGFNCLDFVPISMNKYLLTTLLRNKLHFKGPVISDYNAIHELVNHKVALDDKDACLKAFNAGVDIDLMSACYPNYLEELINEGKISVEALDQKVLRVLELKNKLNLFENPYRFNEEKANHIEKKSLDTALYAAERSMVLLKNDSSFLPLNKDDNILFVGPFVDEDGVYSSWSLFRDENYIGIRDVLKNNSKISYFPTKNIFKEELNNEELSSLKSLIKADTKVVFLVGEPEEESGEASSKTDISLNENIVSMIKSIHDYTDNVMAVIYGGRPIAFTKIDNIMKAIIYAFIPGSLGAKALINILYGKANPSAKLAMSIPYNTGQIPVFYQSLKTGRPKENQIEENRYYSHYLDAPNEPLYSFGYGLSYSKFVYSNLKLDKLEYSMSDKIIISVDVKNDSNVRGEEAVLLYVEDLIGSVSRPRRELKAFKKLLIKSGEIKTIEFIITEKDLRFTGLDKKVKCEKGEFKVYIEKLEGLFIIK